VASDAVGTLHQLGPERNNPWVARVATQRTWLLWRDSKFSQRQRDVKRSTNWLSLASKTLHNVTKRYIPRAGGLQTLQDIMYSMYARGRSILSVPLMYGTPTRDIHLPFFITEIFQNMQIV
jgi:hypothetical protein